LRSQRVHERNRLWLLKNSFQAFSTATLVRKLLNVRSPEELEFTEITALVTFSTATPVNNSYPGRVEESTFVSPSSMERCTGGRPECCSILSAKGREWVVIQS